jgi:hypothetical protein
VIQTALGRYIRALLQDILHIILWSFDTFVKFWAFLHEPWYFHCPNCKSTSYMQVKFWRLFWHEPRIQITKKYYVPESTDIGFDSSSCTNQRKHWSANIYSTQDGYPTQEAEPTSTFTVGPMIRNWRAQWATLPWCQWPPWWQDRAGKTGGRRLNWTDDEVESRVAMF